MKSIEELTRMGFCRWQKNGMDRMYINASSLGLDCTYYKTGNISSATFNGESISNSEARGLKYAKTYIDLVNNVIVSDSARLAAAVADLLGIDYSYGQKQITIPDDPEPSAEEPAASAEETAVTVADAVRHYQENADHYNDIVYVNASTSEFLPEETIPSLMTNKCRYNDMMSFLYVWIEM